MIGLEGEVMWLSPGEKKVEEEEEIVKYEGCKDVVGIKAVFVSVH